MRATGDSMQAAPPTEAEHDSAGNPPLGPVTRVSDGPSIQAPVCRGSICRRRLLPGGEPVIEVDGSVHDFAEPAAKDEVRDEYIRSLGLRIVRVPPSEVFDDATRVVDALVAIRLELAGPSTTQLR